MGSKPLTFLSPLMDLAPIFLTVPQVGVIPSSLQWPRAPSHHGGFPRAFGGAGTHILPSRPQNSVTPPL